MQTHSLCTVRAAGWCRTIEVHCTQGSSQVRKACLRKEGYRKCCIHVRKPSIHQRVHVCQGSVSIHPKLSPHELRNVRRCHPCGVRWLAHSGKYPTSADKIAVLL